MARSMLLLLAVFALVTADQEVPAADAPAGDAPKEDAEEDATTNIMKQLTIAMASEVIDERTFSVRDAASKGRKLIRLGNVAPIEKGSLTDEEYQERVEAGKAALSKLVEKQMMLWKAAPEENQPKGEDEDLDGELIIADAWTVDGRHMPTLLKKEGHLIPAHAYESELAKDILSAAADEEKREAYKKLEEALKESEAAKAAERAEQARAQQAQEEAENTEPIGFGGWIGLGVLGVLIVGAVTNFGRADKKKVNLNRKKGVFEKLSGKFKGQ